MGSGSSKSGAPPLSCFDIPPFGTSNASPNQRSPALRTSVMLLDLRAGTANDSMVKEFHLFFLM